jgi:hypothetical protein
LNADFVKLTIRVTTSEKEDSSSFFQSAPSPLHFWKETPECMNHLYDSAIASPTPVVGVTPSLPDESFQYYANRIKSLEHRFPTQCTMMTWVREEKIIGFEFEINKPGSRKMSAVFDVDSRIRDLWLYVATFVRCGNDRIMASKFSRLIEEEWSCIDSLKRPTPTDEDAISLQYMMSRISI